MTKEKATNYLRERFNADWVQRYLDYANDLEGDNYWLDFSNLDELVSDFEYFKENY